MALYYFDASAVVKYSIPEPGSTWVRQLLDVQAPASELAQHLILVAEVTRVEVAAGLAVLERVGRIRRAQRVREYQHFTSHLIQRYAIIPLTTNDYVTAAHLTQHHPLKAYDAVQLAVALRYGIVLTGHPFTFVSGDTTLLTAAHGEGLATENPFNHVTPEEQSGHTESWYVYACRHVYVAFPHGTKLSDMAMSTSIIKGHTLPGR
jgi:uncharacterized protein